jgi:hypothetical protein
MQSSALALAIIATLGSSLAGCGTAAKPSRLAANAIACRSPAAVTELRASGERYQRVADDHLASGRCRVFSAGHAIEARAEDHGLLRFVDPGTGATYWSDARG